MFDHWCRQLWGTGARAPLDFQLCNFSGHFRAAQTLTFESMPSQYKNKQTRSFVTVYGMDFIFLCVIHKLFSLSFMFPLHQILVMPLCLKLHIVINYLRPSETDQNVLLFVPLSLASAKFRKIPGKHRNSVETGKFLGSARNSVMRGKLWSLIINEETINIHEYSRRQ